MMNLKQEAKKDKLRESQKGAKLITPVRAKVK